MTMFWVTLNVHSEHLTWSKLPCFIAVVILLLNQMVLTMTWASSGGSGSVSVASETDTLEALTTNFTYLLDVHVYVTVP